MQMLRETLRLKEELELGQELDKELVQPLGIELPLREDGLTHLHNHLKFQIQMVSLSLK